MAEPVRVRRDIWSLEAEQEWHPITRAYALAVAAMRDRDSADPASWTFQAQVHGMPDGGQPDGFRGRCQHETWFFLPWHRLYLHAFERIVLAAVRAHRDIDEETKANWALPYWDYGKGGTHATLPAAFRQEEHPDGTDRPNPLFVASRNSFINDGEALDERAASAEDAFAEGEFSLPAVAGGFGGAATAFNHWRDDADAFPGMLEQTPHGDVHMEVGGDMGAFATAGLDPVFWLHHANIDRLWECWLGQGGRTNPDATGSWGTTRFEFHGPDGTSAGGSAAGVLDTATQLGYEYEDTTVPAPRRRARRRRVSSQPPPEHPAELVGATEQPLELTGGPRRVELSVGEPTGPARRRGAREEGRVYLTVEGITGDRNPDVTYAVYLNLPDDADPDDEPELHYAGNVSFFGIELTRRLDADPGAHGLARSFDVTEIVSELRDADRWDPEQVSVTFVPLRRGRDTQRRRGSAEPEGQGPPVTVGRIGVYVQ